MTNPNFQPTSVYYTTPGQFQHLQGQVNDVGRKKKILVGFKYFKLFFF